MVRGVMEVEQRASDEKSVWMASSMLGRVAVVREILVDRNVKHCFCSQ